MSFENHDTTVRTAEERAAVSTYLENEGGEWTSMPPDYTNFSHGFLAQKLEDVYKAVIAETNARVSDVDTAYEASQLFLDKSFDMYEGRADLGRKIGRAFVVPMRSNRRDDDYATESTPFYPLLDPVRFGVDSNIRMRTMYGLPPTVLDTYLKSNDDNETGALVLSPVYSDMTADIRPDKDSIAQRIRLLEVGGHILKATAEFAHHRLGAEVIGLGATLPKVTYFGQALRNLEGMENLTTTTGHGGTVYTIVETARKIMEETAVETHGKIGVIGGAGSIGWSSTIATSEMINDHTILSYDINTERLYGMIAINKKADKVSVAESAAEVLRDTNIILTAITDRIDLNDPAYDDLDLTGKVIIDDSQPGCFDAKQVEAKGGKLVWVVGEDTSDSAFITRDGYHTNGIPYNYGDQSGLYGYRSEFACGQEAAVIRQTGRYSDAITGPVQPYNVRVIGELFHAAGVRVAPFQAFAKPVHID